jgi:hypothetical protein
MAHRRSPAATAATLAFGAAVLTGAGSGLYGLMVLMSSVGFDQAAPTRPGQRWIAIAGIGVVVAFLALAARGEGLRLIDRDNVRLVGILVLVGAACSVPLWRRDSTIDVTDAGFHRARYGSNWMDLQIYNATDAPVVICVGADGVCTTEPLFPARLRAPGLAIAPRDRVSLDWPGITGRITLTINGPLPAGARRNTAFTKSQPSDSHHDAPDPHWPPAPPPPPPIPPLR